MTSLHHVALCVTEFDQYVDLFLKLGMQIRKTAGEAPKRQLWFCEGIQLNETAHMEPGNSMDHFALGTDDRSETKKIALENGCTPLSKGDNWIALPNGVRVELMEI